MLLLGCCLWLLAAPAAADDVADEAEVEFRIGAARYEQADYQGALAHFLASNRLAPNRNVLFNIALSYERLAQLPEAYRYYARSLEGETDPVVSARVRAALERLEPRVPRLHVVTEPPGARLYLDRRDLGERGAAPQTLALAPGQYRVLAELEGYELAESPPVELRVGVLQTVTLQLRRIVGTVRLSGATGATVYLDSDSEPALCQAPCEAPVPPGQHTLIVSRPGFRTARVPVLVKADEVTSLSLYLVPESGSLVVTADEAGAILEVDGVVRGTIPGSFELPVGTHRLRVSLRGFQPIEREVTLRANEQQRLELLLQATGMVEAASRMEERAEDAPASISLIGSRELRGMRYPTVAEALRGTRGLYVTDDRGYVSVGVRGLALPGSYGKRVLVTLDGMPTNDNWMWASFSGFDLRTDLEDIDRIEVVRGPGSVVYGTSAFTGVINLVSRGREVPSGVEAGVSAAADGVFRARARVTRHFTAERGLWLSVSGGRSEGRDFFFREYVADTPPEIAGHARGLDRAWFTTLSGRAWWHDLTLAWSFNHHDKQLPTGQFGSVFGDPRSRQSDTRAFLEARLERKLSAAWTSLTRGHANLYAYRSRTPYAGDVGLDRTRFDGAWFGLEQRLMFQPSPALRLSLGSEVQGFPLAHARESNEELGQYLDTRERLLLAAAYASAAVKPMAALELSAGARFDYYSSSGASLNPRLALIAQPYAAGNLKLLFGKAFIAPSVSEFSYSYAGLESNPDLRPENLYSAELEWSHQWSPLLVSTASVYANYVADLILLEQLPPGPDGDDRNQYQNARTPIGTLGGELELRRDWKQGWMLAASYSLQRSAYLRSRRLTDLLTLRRSPQFRQLPNSPRQLGSLRAAAPLFARQLRVMSRLSYEGARYDRYSSLTDPTQSRARGALYWDFVLSGREERVGLDYSLGLYNALDAQAEHPASEEFLQRTIPSTGRSLLALAQVSF